MRTTLAALVAALATVTTAVVVFGMKIGPVIATLTGSHGIHTGDLAGAAIGAARWATAWAVYRTVRAT